MNLLPIAKQISAQTLGQDLVDVKPLSGLTKGQMEERKREIRRRKLIVLKGEAKYDEFDDLPYEEEIKKGMPSMDLIYMDYTYGLYI